MLSKEEIYEERTLKEYAKNPHGTRMDVVYSAMDEYAKQEAIGFEKWLWDNIDDGLKTDELYQQYLNSKIICP